MSGDKTAREEAGKIGHTPGPWFWHLNRKSRQMALCSVKGGQLTVMDFVRWGMGGAIARFRVGNLMKNAYAFGVDAPNREHHADWFQLT